MAFGKETRKVIMYPEGYFELGPREEYSKNRPKEQLGSHLRMDTGEKERELWRGLV